MKYYLLTPQQTADFLGVSLRTFWNLKDRGLPVSTVSVSDKRNSYRVSLPDLVAWYHFKKKYVDLEIKEKIEVDKNAEFYANTM